MLFPSFLIGSDKGPTIEPVETTIAESHDEVLRIGPLDIGKGQRNLLGGFNMGTRGRPISHIFTGPPITEIDNNRRPFMGTVGEKLSAVGDNESNTPGAYVVRPIIMNPRGMTFPQHLNSLRLTKPNIAEVPSYVK